MQNSNSFSERHGKPGRINADTRLALAVLLASGMAALGHELLWTRRLIDLLGASTESSARVFECFFLGLCLGAAAAALLLPRIKHHWHMVGCVELGVAVLSVPALLLPEWTAWVWPSLGPERLVSWQGSLLKTVFSMLMILPPTFLMGMTLPVLISAVIPSSSDRTRKELLLYSANTLGGVLGLGLVVLISLQTLGGTGSMLLMMGINVAIAIACFRRAKKSSAPLGASTHTSDASAKLPSAGGANQALSLFLAFLSGAGVLALEVLGLALANLSAPLSIYPQASILICVILLLSIAAWLVSRLATNPGTALRMLLISLAATCLMTALIPVIFLHLPGVESGLFGYGHSFGNFLLILTGNTLASLGPAILCAGTVFPLVVSWSKRQDVRPGRQMGLLLASSGVGGIAGAEAAYHLLLPNFAVHVSMGVIGTCYGLASLGLMFALKEKHVGRYLWSLGAFLFTCYLISAVLVGLPVYYQADLYKVINLRVGREGSLAVVEDGRSRVMIFDNQYTLGGTAITPSLRRQAHLPLLLHPAPHKVGFIGLGTGITASGALEHKAVESITCVELSPLVAAAAARDFDEFNHSICRDPKVAIHVEDARIYLEASRGSFDVVIGDLFTPWRPGEASLSSLEEFRAAREALRAGGVYCQWIELTQWTPEQFQIAATTFRKAFGHLYLFRTSFQTGSVPVGLVGFKDGTPDWNVVARRCDFEAREGKLLDPICRHPEGVGMLYLGEFVPPAGFDTMINTLNNLRIELLASRQVVLIDSGTHFSGTGEHWLSLLDRQASSAGEDVNMPNSLRPYPKLGALATRFEIALAQSQPAARGLAQSLTSGIDQAIQGDSKANWSLWPGSMTPWEFLKAGASGSSGATK